MGVRIIGIIWHQKDTFETDLAAMVDRKEMHNTYENWLKAAHETWQTLSEMGFTLVEVPFNLEEFSRWCKQNRLKRNGKARSRWASEMVLAQQRKEDFTRITSRHA
ncbi:MAG: hypothetical protein IT168_07020 [Bryobacterales bacterium]|nr:hypothetical protein [Bryobacterales bacterium]